MVHCSLSIPIAIPDFFCTLNQKSVKTNRTDEIYREREGKRKTPQESWASAAEPNQSSALMKAPGLSVGIQTFGIRKMELGFDSV